MLLGVDPGLKNVGPLRSIEGMNASKTQASSYLIAFATSLLLAACGGGGSSEGEPQPPPGSLDPSFGNAGTVINSTASFADGIALQPDGKIVVAAGKWLIRYDRDGVLDATFGTGGLASTAPNGNGFVAGGVSLQPDGKIVAAGSVSGPGGDYHCTLARYSNDGAIDSTFGDGGLVVWDRHGNVSNCTGLAIQVDGGIVLGIHVGTVPLLGGPTARFDVNGNLDMTFGTNGVAVGGGAIVIQPDGKILSAPILRGHGLNECAVTRVGADGVTDTAFGDGGFVAWTGPFDEEAPLVCALARQPDGKIVVLNHGSVARFLENGAPDSGFGGGGVVTGLPGVALAVQSNGKIVVVGGDGNGYPQKGFALWRLGTDGQPDTEFGNSGTVVTPLLGDGDAVNLAIQPDGRIIASGSTAAPGGVPGTRQAALARYFGD